MTSAGSEQAIVLVVSLFVHPGREGEFHRFETEAARIMRRHGGRIDRVIRPTGPPPEASRPHEIHVVTFASAAAFEAYRADPELRVLGPLRESAIARTDVTICVEGEPYGAGAS
jgi:hypothetical protein